jgi:hypothetical protein
VNRRHFFGMTAAALIGAGLPLSLLPERSVFLPPREGWYPSDFVMREVIQYDINGDALAIRHDAMFDKEGETVIASIFDRLPTCAALLQRGPTMIFRKSEPVKLLNDRSIMFDDRVLRPFRIRARDEISRMAFRDGLTDQNKLLPIPNVEHGRYV